MMMKDDKKKMAGLIIAKMGKPQEDAAAPMEDGAEQDDSMAVNSAAEEVLKAVKSDSPEQLVEAMKSLIQLIGQPSEDEPPQEPDQQ